MINEATGEDIVIPKTELDFEALHAIYERPCVGYFFRLIEQNRFKVAGILPFVSVKEQEEDPRFFVNNRSVFTNINTISDLKTVQRG
jgi:molybdopterin-guanine dinucleotide biosynthesis protein A